MKRVTERQVEAIHFIENWLDVKFEGNINNYFLVSLFIGQYLDDAIQVYEEAKADYESWLWEKLTE